ncbi:hypothetical protein F4801DRAFT_583518 [Xylaria longipes]|nr:hypothetical protein F4801DRAFT_583518 [Xylaria longipes]RYC60719.1 hypothetical protein CHU98_g5480 [Xylaria longipes]
MASPLPPRRKSSIERLSTLVESPSSTQLTREEFLWAMRTGAEGGHRAMMYRYGVVRGYGVKIGNPLREMDLIDMRDTCNKSVPIYILAGKSHLLLNVVLHNYIYRRWFRPYRSEIEHERFFCKFIIAGSFPKETRLSHSTTAAMISVNKDVCAGTDKTRLKFHQMLVTGGSCLPSAPHTVKVILD